MRQLVRQRGGAMSDRAIRPPWRKRYGWFRLYNDFPDHPKWRVAADHAQVHVSVVVHFAVRLMACANKSAIARGGRLDKYNTREFAISLNVTDEMCDRVYGALEGLGWIDQGFIPEWYDRQPDDPTSAERQERWRSKRDRERDRKRDQRDRHAANQRAYRLRKKANGLAGAERVTGDVTLKTQTSKKEREASVTAIATGQTVTWKDVQENGYVPAKQRALPLPPVPLNQRGNR